MRSLPLFHRISGRPVIVLGEGAAAEAKRRLVARAGGRCAGEGETGAQLAFVALEGTEADAAAARLRSRGLLVNVVDRPELCDFTTPSIVDREPLLVAVGTGGASAGLAKAVRLRLEEMLPQSLGQLAEALFAARATMRARWPDASERRHALDAALAVGGVLDPLDDGAAARVDRWLIDPHHGGADHATEIHLRSADPDDLTVREARLLGAADVVAHDRNVPDAILARARADAVRIALTEDLPSARLVVVLRGPHRAG